ncbi:hypothetical protein LOTGIDRAFT_157798 [Lottia gigantea]|uniref:Tetraspanin n=1 Tax=Lottia gigantea TaxID=225164 RepID=V4B2F2_LOTGI|nr:hypothetical protein LOTGIDRAFT_157798 [Lottia gigantea]ESP00522.1 hypothetical protein LOTGIDRAFT_157798 [Lottia gigantea]
MTGNSYSLESEELNDDLLEFRRCGYDQNKGIGLWIKYLFVVFLVVGLFGALAILGIGIWTYEAEYGSKVLSKLIGVNLYQVDSYILIGVGSAIIFVTMLGICGLVAQYRCLMGLHLSLLAFTSVMLFVAGILGYVLISELEDKVRSKMDDTLVNHYGIDIDKNAQNLEITEAWDEIQKNFECCGVYGDVNETNSWAIYKQRSKWFLKSYSNETFVPASCCENRNEEECRYLTNSTYLLADPVVQYPTNANFTLYTYGCFDKLDPYLEKTGIVIGTTAITVGVLLLIELVLSILMYRMLPPS